MEFTADPRRRRDRVAAPTEGQIRDVIRPIEEGRDGAGVIT
jgi:hypothetical protein